MRILYIDVDYPRFLDWLYGRDPSLRDAPFETQQEARFATCFGQADFYPRHLKRLGHEVLQTYVNNQVMQERWLHETEVSRFGRIIANHRRFKEISSVEPHDILLYQAKMFRPDVIIVQTSTVGVEVLKALKRRTKLLVGDFSAPLAAGFDATVFDLILSAAAHYVERFRQMGVASEFIPLAFEASIADLVGERSFEQEVTFIGSVSMAHRQRREWLEALAGKVEITIHGDVYAEPDQGSPSPLAGLAKPPLWGMDMFRALRRSKVTLNRHIDVAGPIAGNMRLFEATGVGACLVTDWKENLGDFFEIGTEVVAYRTVEECVDLVRYYLRHDAEREAITRAGQARCLRDHTYERRAERLTDLLRRYL